MTADVCGERLHRPHGRFLRHDRLAFEGTPPAFHGPPAIKSRPYRAKPSIAASSGPPHDPDFVPAHCLPAKQRV